MTNLQTELFDQSVYATTVAEVTAPKTKRKRKDKPRPLDIASITLDFIKSLPSVALRDRRNLPVTSGVYFVLVGTSEGTKVGYIGMSSCFLSRWESHNHLSQLILVERVGVPVTIAWLEMKWHRYDIDSAEAALIKKFKPPLNQVHISVRESEHSPTIELDDFTKKRIADNLTYSLESLRISQLRAIANELKMKIYKSWLKDRIVDEVKNVLGKFYDENLPDRRMERPKWSRNTCSYVEPQISQDALAMLQEPLEDLSIRELKKIASNLDVYRYSHLLKLELIAEIRRKKSQLEFNSQK